MSAKKITRWWACALVALLACLVPLPVSAAEPVRVMALGDSITGSPGCWRVLLWQHLRDTGRTNADFVGTPPAPGRGFAYDGENEGHGGFLATRIAAQNQLPGWLAATRPAVVLMHLGTNDVWNNISAGTIPGACTTVLNQMRASNPGMHVLVAQIIPMNPSGCAACGQRVVELDNAIPGWARPASCGAGHRERHSGPAADLQRPGQPEVDAPLNPVALARSSTWVVPSCDGSSTRAVGCGWTATTALGRPAPVHTAPAVTAEE